MIGFVSLVVYFSASLSFTTAEIRNGVQNVERCIGCNFARVGQFPYIATISYDGQYYCTGTILSEYDVLTAQHCVVGGLSGLSISAGIVDFDALVYEEAGKWRQDRAAEGLTTNPESDMAIIRLERPLSFVQGYVSSINLTATDPPYNEDIFPHPIVVGFGLDLADPHHMLLRYTTQNHFLDDERCQQRMRHVSQSPDFILDFENDVCVYTEEGLGGCYGNSGSPLIFTNLDRSTPVPRIAGVLHGGPVCGVGEPYIYSSVAAQINWIIQNAFGDVEIV